MKCLIKQAFHFFLNITIFVKVNFMKRAMKVILFASHLALAGIGFAAGIYILPVLTAEKGSTIDELKSVKDNFRYQGEFNKNQKGSNAVHWAEGNLFVNDREIAFEGTVAPGPDYKIYLTKKKADSKDEFIKIKEDSLYIGDLKSFGNFIKTLPNGVNIDEYSAVQIWCESFGQFISSASFK